METSASFGCVLALAILAVLSNWFPGVRSNAVYGRYWPFNRRGTVMLGLVVLFTLTHATLTWRKENAAEREVVALQTRLASAHDTISLLQSQTLASFQKDLDARIWKQHADLQVNAVRLGAIGPRFRLEGAASWVEGTRKFVNAAHEEAIATGLKQADKEFDDSLGEFGDSIVVAFESYGRCFQALGVRPDALATWENAQRRLREAMRSLYVSPFKNAKFPIDGSVARLTSNQFVELSEMFHDMAQLVVEGEYLERLGRDKTWHDEALAKILQNPPFSAEQP